MANSIFDRPNTINDILGFNLEDPYSGAADARLNERGYSPNEDMRVRGIFGATTSPRFNVDRNTSPTVAANFQTSPSSGLYADTTAPFVEGSGMLPEPLANEVSRYNRRTIPDLIANALAQSFGLPADMATLVGAENPKYRSDISPYKGLNQDEYPAGSMREFRPPAPVSTDPNRITPRRLSYQPNEADVIAKRQAELGVMPSGRLPSEPMALQTENLKKLLTQYGITSDNELPITQFIADLIVPYAGVKAARRGFSVLNQADNLKPLDNVIANDTISPASLIDAPRKTNNPEGVSYVTGQQGPFFRVTPSGLSEGKTTFGGIKETNGGATGIDTGGSGSIRGEVPQRYTNEEVERLRLDPNNFLLGAANKYTNAVTGAPIAVDVPSSSSLAKQSAIGSVFLTAVEGSPQYKSSIFDAYARAYPDLLQSVGAKNYDDLLEKSYRQLAKETDQQFKTLPLKMSYHKNGEGNYDNSRELIEDLYGNKHIYVYQGGDKHDFLNRVDPVTGLNENEKFRAVHDAFGHGLAGNQFGPKGEEKAWELHKQMYSPLARFAMTAETRGQNSVANYSPLNAELKQILSEFDRAADIAQRRGDVDSFNRAKAGKRLAFSNFEFAPNRALLLPPEFVESSYSGSMPSYLSGIIRPPAGTETPSVLTHFSTVPNLSVTDPTRYGTGIRGAEANRLKSTTNPALDRTYFYGGEPETVIPESGLGQYRYRTEAPMYDISADPMKFSTLAKESNRVPFSSQVNAGSVDSAQQLTDMERLIKEYGYAGFINPNLPKPAGVSFNPLPVERRAIGGLINVKE